MNITQNKTIDQTTVETVVNDLIKKNRSTTSLDVKNELRAQGYFAKQDAVSAFVEAIATANGLSKVYNNGFYTYSEAAAPVQPASTASAPSAPTVPATGAAADIISATIGIYRAAISATSTLKRDLGFTTPDYYSKVETVIATQTGKPVTIPQDDATTVQNVQDLIDNA